MSKTSILYLSMVTVFVVGLWTTIHLGRSLRAPHDVSGKWVIAPADPAAATAPKAFAISQSGRFVKLKVDDRKPINLVLASDTVGESGRQMVFEGDGQAVSVHSDSTGPATDAVGVYQFRFQGPIEGTWTAKRDAPADAAPKPAAKH